MVARGTIQLPTSGTSKTLNLTKELINFRAGVVNKNIPGLSSSRAFQAAIFGRGREITLEGWFAGTQAETEAWLDFFEDWINADVSFQETARYYPMFHNSNQQNGTQDNYWNVLGTEFQWEHDEEEPGKIRFVLTMNEGTKAGAFNTTSGG